MKTTIALVTCLAAGAAAVAAQPMFHGNLAHTGVYDQAGPRKFGSVKWTFKTGSAIVASPTIADGVVYVGSTDGYIYAVDQETGKEKWKHKTRQQITSTAAVSNGVVYFESTDGVLYALAADTGNVKWGFMTEVEKRFEAKGTHGYPPTDQTIPDAWDLFTSSPAVAGGKVYFGSGDGNVYALDANTGVVQWRFSTKDVVHASPAVINGIVYVGSWDSNLYAIDAETGQEKWRFKAGEDPVYHNQVGFQSSPTVVDDTVYVGCRDGHVYALDAATGRKKWDFSTSKSWVLGTPAVLNGTVYVGTSDSFRFHALDAKTGRPRFTVDAKGWVFSSAALSGELAYVGCTNGKLYAIDTKTGNIAWEYQTESARTDTLKVLKPDGGINRAAFTPVFNNYQDMDLDIYRMFSVGAIFSSPILDRGVVYFSSADGNLYALQ
jgi:outer membrane protein assembly factor BamB